MSEAAIVCILLGLIFTLGAAFEIFCGLETVNWRATKGEVIDAFLAEREFTGQDPTVYGYNLTRSYWLPRVTYKYSVGGKEYEGNTLNRRLHHTRLKFLCEWRIRNYRTGDDVTVFFYPRDPRLAVLKRGACGADYISLVLGVMLLALAKVLS